VQYVKGILPAVLIVVGGCAGGAGSVGGPEDTTPTPALGAAGYETYRDASRELARFDPGGRISRIRWDESGASVSFTRLGEAYVFDIDDRALAPVEPTDDEAGATPPRGPRRRGPGRGRQRASEPSPDGQWRAVCRDWNVWLEPVASEDDTVASGPAAESETGDEPGNEPHTDPVETQPIQVTADGHRKLRYGTASWVYGEELGQTTSMWWSPDSSRLVFYEFDEAAVPDFYLLRGLTDLRTRTVREGYPKPGEPNPTAKLLVYDVATGETTRIDTDGPGATTATGAPDETDATDEDEWYVYNVRFAQAGNRLIFSRTNRHQSVLHVEIADLDTGAVRAVVTETQATWQSNRPRMHFLDDGERFIWETERSGTRQYELRHLDGRRLATLTRNRRPVTSIVRVDEDAGRLYYTAYGEEHPLDVHFYRVDLDGADQRRLTSEAGRHQVTLAPSGKWFISRYETVTRPPTTAIYDTDGNRLGTLARSDDERIDELDYPAPELFSFTAADGVTEIFGWLHKPRGFDPRKRYPLVIDVYGGPGSKGVRNSYRPGHAATALGFIVAKIDNRGTGGRGKTFLGSVYQKLGIVDIRDQADGVRHLAKRPYIDGTRVGIYGHSYGGYMAALAILKYPDVFHVAVAGAPVTDWRNYDTIYTERYMRTPEENPEGYDDGSCLTYAGQLEGNLLILHGMVDDNVHPTNTWQLVNALQDADKSFDVMFYPNSGHGLRGHAQRARIDYLSRHLLASE